MLQHTKRQVKLFEMSFDLDLLASPRFWHVCRNSVSQLLRFCKDQTTTPGTPWPTLDEIHCYTVYISALCVIFLMKLLWPWGQESVILTLNLSPKNGKVEYFINLIKL